jgi:membrane protease YdiL (CAAX protease family)
MGDVGAGSQEPMTRVSGKRLGLVMAVWVVASLAAAGITVGLLRDRAPGSLSPIIVGEVYALLIGAMAFVLRQNFRDSVALRGFRTGYLALAASACAVAYGLVAGLETLVAPAQWKATVALLHAVGSDDGRLASAGPVLAGFILLRSCLLAPIGEELLFRGALYAWLRSRLTATTTVAITAAAFAMIHGYPPLMALAFVLGLGFGVVRELSGSSLPLIIVHVANNVLLSVLSLEATGWTARLPVWGGQ